LVSYPNTILAIGSWKAVFPECELTRQLVYPAHLARIFAFFGDEADHNSIIYYLKFLVNDQVWEAFQLTLDMDLEIIYNEYGPIDRTRETERR
jgi:hypothetical protein